MDNKFSFLRLFSEQIEVTKDINAVIDKIVIPKIQRPYAQGRENSVCNHIRETFVTELFEALIERKGIELNFIYGIIQSIETNKYVMELLDGQQRLTTLFLLYWYIVNIELDSENEFNIKVRDCLKKFVYETRPTSSIFCEKLAEFETDLSTISPVKAIRETKWYFKSFENDSTIKAMLVMLECIHKTYNLLQEEKGILNLHESLELITFYVKSLGYYNLSEELYIKMNARGLPLTSFENFKADLTNYIAKKSFEYEPYRKLVALGVSNVPFYQSFAIKLDSKWIDIFWGKDVDIFDPAYLRFITRFFAVKYIIDSKDNVSNSEMQYDEVIKQFHANSNEKNDYVGFGRFKSILDGHPEHIITLDKVFDAFCGKELEYIQKELVAIWDRNSNNEDEDFYRNFNQKFSHQRLVLFAAIIEFIDVFSTFDECVFQKWMRVVWNVIENSNIDKLPTVSSLIRQFSYVIHEIAYKMANGNSFYEAMSGLKEDKEISVPLLGDEIEKACRIVENQEWESVFKEAEMHPFLRGIVMFFYRDRMQLEEFKHNYSFVKNMFDKDGISKEYKKKHVLMRALISCYSSYSELMGTAITESSESNKYLKHKLYSEGSGKDRVVDSIHTMFNTLLPIAKSDEELKKLLEEHIKNAPWDDWGDLDMGYLKKTLRNNIRLYNWIEQYYYRNIFKISNKAKTYGKVTIAVERERYARLQVDAIRDYFIKEELLKKYNFELSEFWQRECYNKHKLLAGTKIELYNNEFGDKNSEIRLEFGPKKDFAIKIKTYSESIVEKIEAILPTDCEKWDFSYLYKGKIVKEFCKLKYDLLNAFLDVYKDFCSNK